MPAVVNGEEAQGEWIEGSEDDVAELVASGVLT